MHWLVLHYCCLMCVLLKFKIGWQPINRIITEVCDQLTFHTSYVPCVMLKYIYFSQGQVPVITEYILRCTWLLEHHVSLIDIIDCKLPQIERFFNVRIRKYLIKVYLTINYIYLALLTLRKYCICVLNRCITTHRF